MAGFTRTKSQVLPYRSLYLKAIQPKQFPLTLACAGCGFRTTDSVESFHRIPSEIPHCGMQAQHVTHIHYPQAVRSRVACLVRREWIPAAKNSFQVLSVHRVAGCKSTSGTRTRDYSCRSAGKTGKLECGRTLERLPHLCRVALAGHRGNPSDEVRHLKATIRHVHEFYGRTPAAEFEPLALKVVRRRFVEQGWCRRAVNACGACPPRVQVGDCREVSSAHRPSGTHDGRRPSARPLGGARDRTSWAGGRHSGGRRRHATQTPRARACRVLRATRDRGMK